MFSKIKNSNGNKVGKTKFRYNKKVNHKFKVLTPDYINSNRSNAYDYIVTV